MQGASDRAQHPRFRAYVDKMSKAIQHTIDAAGVHHAASLAMILGGFFVFYAKVAGRDKKHAVKLVESLWERTDAPSEYDVAETIGEWQEDERASSLKKS